ncbi:MAG: hypothetical protein QGH25_10520, partial [Candidatus Latescibacteria bacterium]|nr:hypothetical protein [Candidatus Latescibacterota bacterium]
DRPDYPYRRDQRGAHGFLDFAVPYCDRLLLGYYRSVEIAGAGESKAAYLRWQTGRASDRWGSIDLLGDIKRVADSIADPTFIWKTSTDPRVNSIVVQETSGQYNLVDLKDPDPDLLQMRNSTVGTFYVNAELKPRKGLTVDLRYKWLRNRQHADTFADGSVQDSRTLSRLTLSHKVEYSYPLRSHITLKARFRHLHWQDAGYSAHLRQHWTTYGPLFEQELKLTEHTVFVAGQEGIPGLFPVRHRQRNDPGRDFDRWIDILMLRTRSTYLGWNTVTELGVQYERRETEAEELTNRTFFVEMFFGF